MSSLNPRIAAEHAIRQDSASAADGVTEIISIQYLRGLAALGVVVVHASTALLNNDKVLIPFGIGNAGVDLFFIISGFIMYLTTAHRSVAASDFYLKRLIRIFPLYFCSSTLAFLIARLAPHIVRIFSGNPKDYIRSVLFIPYYCATCQSEEGLKRLIRPEIGQGWTLNYEGFFYLVFGLCLCIPRRFRVQSLVIIFSLLSALGILFRPVDPILRTYTDSLQCEFVFGVLLGYVFCCKVPKSLETLGVTLLIAGGATSVILQLSILHTLPRVLGFGLPAATVIGCALWLERAGLIPRLPFFLLLGDASYSLYIFHTFVLAVLRRGCQRLFNVNLACTHIVFMICSTLIAEMCGILVFKYAERPVTRTLTEWRKRRRAASVGTPVTFG
jgi:exopolysaccharide production protein ExoZ